MSTLKITRESLLDGSLSRTQRQMAETLAKTVPDASWRTEEQMATLLEQTLASHNPEDDLHIFGYGSLIWNPAFHYVDKTAALLRGWHRRFCLKMYMGRGTVENPGLMLALDRGGACKGVAFRIAAAKVREELGVLWQREMFGGSYNARWVTLQAPAGRLRALTFVVDRTHPRYMRELTDEQTATLIATGAGNLGTCREYLENTVNHLATLGLSDAGLTRLVALLPKK
jgi:cation transport protein ChaC